MRTPIRVLPKELAEKIAAGEVVERPASVIKELVENSLDAGARNVRVELIEGGRKRIAILDDGHGIPEDELPIALERHATSKIQELDDLWNLRTMGFRGEALPSVAAVSRFTIESRADRAARGRRLYLEGGRLIKDDAPDSKSALPAAATGTQILVEDLFYNVPARLKFLKARASEAAQIRELIERVALCNPGVGFTLVSEGRRLLALEAAGAATRAAQVLETAPENLESFESIFEDIVVRGWLDRDGRAPNSRHVYLAVNGRMVRDKLLQQAVLVALRPRMMEGEYPRLFVSVEVAPGDVDVNVHPAKSEVRFRRSRDVFQVVHGALERLARSPSRPYYSTSLPAATEEPGAPIAFAEPERPAPAPLAATAPVQDRLFSSERISYRVKEQPAAPAAAEASSPPLLNFGGLTASFAEASPSPAATKPGFTRLHYIGQLKNTYLLFQDGDGLVVVDQHAAHERINYEKLKASFLSEGLRPQPLLVAAVVKCKPEDVALALENHDAFARLGFEFEAFGDNCLLVRAAPEQLAPARASELFKALLEELRNSDGELVEPKSNDPTRLSAKLERVLSTSACHGSVRAGQALSPQEARELAAQMDETESSLNCPHGRPASVKLTFAQIEGLFKR